MPEAYRLLIGSIGDDSHSVGMFLLEIAFKEAGFFVKNIGILNRLDDFFSRAQDFDAIFISCMNGHADLYLNNFPLELRRFNSKNKSPKTWYLGGNLSVQESAESILRRYRKMGFDFVSPKPISCDDLKKRLLKDLSNKGIKKRRIHHLLPDEPILIPSLEMIDDNPMPDELFQLEREKILDSWPTGQAVWDADIKKNHAIACACL